MNPSNTQPWDPNNTEITLDFPWQEYANSGDVIYFRSLVKDNVTNKWEPAPASEFGDDYCVINTPAQVTRFLVAHGPGSDLNNRVFGIDLDGNPTNITYGDGSDNYGAKFCIGDVDGDERPEIIITDGEDPELVQDCGIKIFKEGESSPYISTNAIFLNNSYGLNFS